MFSSYLLQWFDPPAERIRGFRQTAGAGLSGKYFVTGKTEHCIANFHGSLLISNRYSGRSARRTESLI
jgi:hypothetical protein